MATKKINFVVESLGLSEVSKDVLAGRVHDYVTIFQFDSGSGSFSVRIGANREEDANDAELISFLESLKDGKVFKKVSFDGKMIATQGVAPFSAQTFEEKVVNFYEEATGYLGRNGYATGSFYSGSDDGTLSVVSTKDGYSYLTEAESKEIENAMIQMQMEEANKKERIFLGMLGGFSGALVGALVYAVIAIMGYWAWISAVVGFSLAYLGYRKFAGKIGKFGAFFAFLAGTAGIFLGIVLSWAWPIYDHFKKLEPDLSFLEVFKGTLPFIFEEPELKGKFLADALLWGGVSIVIGIFVIVGLYFDNRDRFKIRRMQ